MLVKDSVILITGAAQRVGRAMALALAGRGAHIAISYLSDEEPWRETLVDLRARGIRSQRATPPALRHVSGARRNRRAGQQRIDLAEETCATNH